MGCLSIELSASLVTFCLPPADQDALQVEALATARRIPAAYLRAQALVDLASHRQPAGPILAEAAASAQTIGVPYWRYRALSQIAPLLPNRSAATTSPPQRPAPVRPSGPKSGPGCSRD
jgi:hypothetical protein